MYGKTNAGANKKYKIVKRRLGFIDHSEEWMVTPRSLTFDVKPYYANWTSLTIDNFCDVNGMLTSSMYQNEFVTSVTNVSCSYNAGNGIYTAYVTWGGGLGGGKRVRLPVSIITMEEA